MSDILDAAPPHYITPTPPRPSSPRHTDLHTLPDVSLVLRVLGGASASRTALPGGAGAEHADAGAQRPAEVHGASASGESERAAQARLLRGLQLAGQQAEILLRTPAQRSAGAAGPLLQDPPVHVWPRHPESQETGDGVRARAQRGVTHLPLCAVRVPGRRGRIPEDADRPLEPAAQQEHVPHRPPPQGASSPALVQRDEGCGWARAARGRKELACSVGGGRGHEDAEKSDEHARDQFCGREGRLHRFYPILTWLTSVPHQA